MHHSQADVRMGPKYSRRYEGGDAPTPVRSKFVASLDLDFLYKNPERLVASTGPERNLVVHPTKLSSGNRRDLTVQTSVDHGSS